MSAIITKFEAKSSRVKAVALHPTLPWLLAAHHNGSIQIYDYRMGSVVEKYEDNEGPVRSCAFHPTQPLFVTAGDDAIVRVYNYRQRKLLFALSGHLDYVRSVAFHHEAPWIVSASDDQTIRIWNWQNRQCIAILSGHNHYVMCAAFHPGREDLLASASLDQTIRVWDLSAIRAKYAPSPVSHGSNGGKSLRASSSGGSVGSASTGGVNPSQIELFAGSGLDTPVKFILEGHDRGVNWVAFHPAKPLILSGSDDRTVKIWRYNDVRAWEVECYRGHSNNVSSVLWHPRSEVVLSDAEDRTLRLWDCSSATGAVGSGSSSGRGRALATVKRDGDRFWCLTVHPTLNIFAAGHDNGMIVFKLDRERPAFSLVESIEGDELFFVKERLLRAFKLDGKAQSDEFVAPVYADAASASLKLPATVSYSPTERAILISPNHISSQSLISVVPLRDKGNPLTCPGSFAQFVGRNRFVALDTSTGDAAGPVVLLRAMNDIKAAKPLIGVPEGIQRLLPGPTGTFLACTSGKVYSMDGNVGRTLGSVDLAGVKYASWAPNYSALALLGRKSISLVNVAGGSFGDRVTLTHTESASIKSGCWDVSGPGAIFFYTTPFHLKYLLPSGDSGIICTISTPLYLVRVKGDLVHALDRTGAVLVLAIDPTECHFKLALASGDQGRIDHLIANSNLAGQAIIAFLREKGHAATALQFVKDPSSRFELAVECLQLEEAISAAEQLNSPTVWNRLGEEALLMGNVEVAKEAFCKARNGPRLAYLSMICGGSDAMDLLSTEAFDSNLAVMHAMWTGDATTAANVLAANELHSLAYLMLASHLGDSNGLGPVPSGADLGSFVGRAGRTQHRECSQADDCGDWPLLFDPVKKIERKSKKNGAALPAVNSGWNDLQLDDNDFAVADAAAHEPGFMGDDLDIPIDEDELAALTSGGGAALIDLELPDELPLLEEASTGGLSERELCMHRDLAHVSPVLKQELQRLALGRSFFLPSVMLPVGRGCYSLALPAIATRLDELEERYFEPAMGMTTQGRFQEAIDALRDFVQLATLVEDDATQKLAQAREYLTGLSLELRRRALGEEEGRRNLELACLFTRCRLRPEHALLALRAALALAYKLACYKTAAHLARRLLSSTLTAPEAVQLQARKVLAVAEKANYSEALEGVRFAAVEADGRELFVDGEGGCMTCGLHECAWCGAKYENGRLSVCSVCSIGSVRACL
jgi:coatomer protein complex subunit alpha (xenin)